MSQHITARLLACTVAFAALSPMAAAQTSSSTYKAPRTANNQPDLQGLWTNASITRLERPATYGDRLIMTPEEVAKTEGRHVGLLAEANKPTRVGATVEEVNKTCEVPDFTTGVACGYNAAWTDAGETVMKVRGQGRTSFITSTPDGRLPPYRPGTKPGPSARISDHPETRSLGERCILSFSNASGPVMLPLLYNNNYQLLQTKDEVAILVEMVHDVRHIRLNTKTHLPSSVRPYMGDSLGWYEGDTLVVETTNFPAVQAKAFRGASTGLKVIERLTRIAPDRISYKFTVEDPSTWEQAWSGEYEFSATKGPIYEYACHEGNYGLEGILAGARQEEAEAAKEAAPKKVAGASGR